MKSNKNSHVSEECAVLIKSLNNELSTVKEQLAHLTRSLSVDLEPRIPIINVPHLQFSPRPSPLVAVRQSPPFPSHPVSTSTEHLPGVGSKQKCKPQKRPVIDVTPAIPSTDYLLGVVDNREEERAKARSRYLCLMRVHIEKQLKQCMEKEKLFQMRRERRAKREKAARLKLKPTRFRSSGVDDKAYLDSVYQSCLYKIIGVEEELKKSGKLKTVSEVKAFWEQVLTPFQSPTTAYQRGHSPLTSECFDRELKRLEEEEEGCTSSWAITALRPEDCKKVTEKYSNSVRDSHSPVPSPFRFTPCKLPDLKPIREILDDNKEERMKSIRKSLVEYEGAMKKHRAHLHQAYQRAKANEMAMRSLLPHQADIERPSFMVCCPSSLSPTSSPTSHLPLVLPPLSHLLETSTEDSRTVVDQAFEKRGLQAHFSNQLMKSQHPLAIKVTASRDSALTSAGVNSTAKLVCVPLTMSELLEATPIKETKAKSLMWSNYQAAGN